MNECLNCSCWDEEYQACTMPASDRWYACKLENTKPENVKALEEWCKQLAEKEKKNV